MEEDINTVIRNRLSKANVQKLYNIVERAKSFNNENNPYRIQYVGIWGSSLRSDKPKDLDIRVNIKPIDPERWQHFNNKVIYGSHIIMGLYNSVREWFNSLEDDEQCLEACKESGEKTKRTVGMRLLIDLYGNDDWTDGNELKELVGLNNEELEWLRYLKFSDSIGNILSLDIRNFVARNLQQNDKKAQVQVINEGEESLMPKQGITFWSADEGFLEVTEDDIQRYLEEEHRELKEETENILADITDIDGENAFVEMNARRKYLDAEQLFSESADDFPYKEQLRQKANEALNWLKVLAIEDPSEQVNSEMRENLKLFEMVGQFKIRLIKYSRIRLKKDSEGNILRDSKGDVLKEYVSCDWDKSMKVLTGVYGKKRVNKLKEFLNRVN